VIRARRGIIACVVAAFALRAAFALVYWTHQPLTHDEREYLALARSLARGEGYRYPADEPDPGTGQQFGRAPGYPAFLAAFIVPVPSEHVPPRVQVVQSAVGAIGVWLIALIASRAAGPRAGVAAAAIAAVYPPLVWSPSYALSETLFSTVALAWIRSDPGAWLALEVRKAVYTVVPAGRSYAVHSAKYVAASVVSYALVALAAVAGVWRWRRAAGHPARGTAPTALWLMAVATILSGLVFFPQERFRLPIIDPALIVTAALLWIRDA
jgi:hypothetical protein